MSERATTRRTGLTALRRAALVALTTGALLAGSFGATAAASAAETPTPTPTTTAAPTPSPTPTATPAPAPTPDATASPAPEPAPAATPQADPTPTPEPAPTAEPSVEPSPDEAPAFSFDAAVATSFRAANIVSDGNFYDGDAMDALEVQSFLNALVPTCDDGYTCLKDYSTTTASMPKDELCAAYQGRSTETAAQIIARVGVACGVSQKALLALLQRESQLVADTFPIQKQYDQALGFDCSDSGPCNPDYAGFFKQVYFGARQLERYRVHADEYQYAVGVPVRIAYNPNPDCGGSTVTIRTQATAALYNYTPYQPNAGALAGDEDDPCASFGNLNFWSIYTDWFGYAQIDVDRVSGADRYSGAVAIAQRSYPGTADVVYLANGATYPDALSAGPAAVEQGGPLLLTDASALPSSVASEIASLKPKRVVVVGGVNSVSDAVKAAVKRIVPSAQVDRIGGASRYETSLLLARDAFPGTVKGAYLATGANFPDALSAGAAAGSKGQPVILVDGSAGAVDAATRQALKSFGVTAVTVVGGPNSVSGGVVASLRSAGIVPTRISGADRYDTSQQVNADAYTASDRAFLATGQNFPDALAGSAWAGAAKAPLYVVQPTCLSRAVRTSFAPLGVTAVTLLGGPNSLGAGVQRLADCSP